jgi:hypothetical protein
MDKRFDGYEGGPLFVVLAKGGVALNKIVSLGCSAWGA